MATTTNEGETSSNIAEMIEELTQPEGTEVLKISTEAVPLSTTSVPKESSQRTELPKDLPSPSSQPGKISKLDILTLSIITDIVLMIAVDVASVQAEELITDIRAKDIPVEASTVKALTIGLVLMIVTHEAIIVPYPEALVVTSERGNL